MEMAERELLVYRIISGSLAVNINNQTYYLKQLSRQDRYQAQIAYNEAFRNATLSGAMTEDELFDMLIEHNIWTSQKQELLTQHQKNIEDFKVGLFESVFQSNKRYSIRNLLQQAKDAQDKLLAERHAYDYLTARGIAIITKLHFTICRGLRDAFDNPVLSSNDWNLSDGKIIEDTINYINRSRLTEKQYRELARTDPWRSIWNAHRYEDLFGIPAVDLTEEQKILVFWSRLYDQISENPDAPGDSVMEDDDMLDGWLIIQRRKRESEQAKRAGESFTSNSRIANADEVYLPAETLEDARRIHAMNDVGAEIARRSTMSLLQKHGSIEDKKLPHVQQRIMQRFNELKAQMKGQ